MNKQNPKDRLSEEYLKSKRKRTWWIIIGIILFMIVSTTIQTYIQQLTVPSPIAGNVVVFSLFNINIILVVILIILVIKNLIKLYFERKEEVLGYKFRTKLIITFILISLIPSILLFWVASGFITNSIDNWFNLKIEASLNDSLDVAKAYYDEVGEKTIAHAKRIAKDIVTKGLLKEGKTELLKSNIKSYEDIDAVFVLDRGLNYIVKEFFIDGDITKITIPQSQLERGMRGEEIIDIENTKNGDFIIGIYPVRNNDETVGIVCVLYYNSKGLIKKAQSITNAFEDYKQLKLLKSPIKTNYVITFLMITLVILFSAIWFGFYLAKGITIPIQRLAEGTKFISEGNLDFKIEDLNADDELGILIGSFNKMTSDLKASKDKEGAAVTELKKTNIELDERRSYIETVLHNIATGVISIDRQGKISTINNAASRILSIDADTVIGKQYKELFDSSHLEPIRMMLKEMHDTDDRESAEREIQFMVSGRMLILFINATILKNSSGKYIGMVIVFDDLTELIKTQKVAAWQDVAKGIAHEIKNPLTPIQLNTERLRKKFFEKSQDFEMIFDECTNTIINEVSGLKQLVNEFSSFARMPAPNPKPFDIHKIIDDTLLLYKESARHVKLSISYDKDVPILNIDPEQIKRVFINLIDNSLDALSKDGEITIKTSFNNISDTVLISFSDNGHGMPANVREKIFLPYFSTKKKGSGLGLAIVNRIITDHNGIIKVTSSEESKGTTFLIELPLYPSNKTGFRV